jgi:hypothetical protein
MTERGYYCKECDEGRYESLGTVACKVCYDRVCDRAEQAEKERDEARRALLDVFDNQGGIGLLSVKTLAAIDAARAAAEKP